MVCFPNKKIVSMVVINCEVNDYRFGSTGVFTDCVESTGVILSSFEALVYEGRVYDISLRKFRDYTDVDAWDAIIENQGVPKFVLGGNMYSNDLNTQMIISKNIRIMRKDDEGFFLCGSVSIRLLNKQTITIQRWIRGFMWKINKKNRLAVMMAFHSRLGARSLLSILPTELIQKIYM
jgi:hypothetical protein